MKLLENKTTLVTGATRGIGRGIALTFAKQGSNVAFTYSSSVEAANELEKELMDLGVKAKGYQSNAANYEAAQQLAADVLKEFGTIDVVLNNAGYGVDGAFEAMSDEVIEKQFDTNVFGLMRVTREAIKAMRPSGSGTIIQISSMGGKITFPLYSIYHATKFAVEGFTESLHYELAQFNIKLKLIEPGPIVTDFYGRSRQFIKPDYTSDYDMFISKFNAAAEKVMKEAEGPEVVAKTIFNAATDNSNKMRYAVGKPGPMLLKLRKLLSDKFYFLLVRKSYNI